jgi:hypothetical protein
VPNQEACAGRHCKAFRALRDQGNPATSDPEGPDMYIHPNFIWTALIVLVAAVFAAPVLAGP